MIITNRNIWVMIVLAVSFIRSSIAVDTRTWHYSSWSGYPWNNQQHASLLLFDSCVLLMLDLFAKKYRLDVWCLHLFSIAWRISHRRNPSCKATPVSVRCEQSTQGGNSLDVWLGRLAMVGFAVAISVEIATGKGLLEVWHVLSLPSLSLEDTF